MTQNQNIRDRVNTTETVESDAAADPQAEIAAEEQQAGSDELTSLRNEVATLKDKMVRQAAEFQNFRRRTENEKSQMVGFGKSFVLQQLLDVFDDLHRSVEAANETAETGSESEAAARFESLKSGVELAQQKLMDELTKLDVHIIETTGSAFNEELHEAIMRQDAPEGIEPGTILAEVQRGFVMGDRVLRHAKVVVAS